jgi:2-methylfumaryl-CoA hydratase
LTGNLGRFFEDYRVGEEIVHATPRTLTEADNSIYTSIYPSRFSIHSSVEFAKSCGLKSRPLDDLIVFHTVFGKTVPDISLNAVANLGYAEGKFYRSVYPGETIRSYSKILGLKENSNGKTGIVYVQSRGENQEGELLLEYTRWVMIKKKTSPKTNCSEAIPKLLSVLDGENLVIPDELDFSNYDKSLAGSDKGFDDFNIGDVIDHVDGCTIHESDHLLSTRLWQNTSKVHFDVNAREDKKRLIYGGHIISLVRALSFNGLENAQFIVAINAGTHVNPVFAEDTVYAWSEVLNKVDFQKRNITALRLRSVGTKVRNPNALLRNAEGRYSSNIVLDFDYWVLMPKFD